MIIRCISSKLSFVDSRIKLIAVYIVTFRRPRLLRRAIDSVYRQTYPRWELRVVNDDPDDSSVGDIIGGLGDLRIKLFRPIRKRGPASAFNEAFRAKDCDFASLLEDDNWWEPRFLEVMMAALERHPQADVACMNERIWKEEVNGLWTNTGRLVWTKVTTELYSTSLHDACGSAKLCNSSLLIRRKDRPAWTIPDDLPVDVTEHFRERVVPQPLLLVGEPLVNYSETIQTNRTRSGTLWGEYQCLLTGSCFASLPPRARSGLAKLLLMGPGSAISPRTTALLSTAVSCPEARSLLWEASVKQIARFVLTLARRPRHLVGLFTLRWRLASHWKFLVESPWNLNLANSSLLR